MNSRSVLESRWRWPLLLLVAVAGLTIYTQLRDSGADDPIHDNYEVTYRVTGPGQISISHTNNQGGENRQIVDVPDGVPWTETAVFNQGERVTLAAHHRGMSAEVTCEIQVNGETEDSARSQGDMVSAYCATTLGR